MLLNFFSFCDVAEFWQIGLQDPATPSVEGMLFFHNTLVIVSIFIGSTVLFMLCAVIFFYDGTKKSKSIQFTHSSKLEAYWTFVPAYILYILAFPSFSLLYSLDDIINKPEFFVYVISALSKKIKSKNNSL
jgi:cytochrome c oxidase subunit 2